MLLQIKRCKNVYPYFHELYIPEFNSTIIYFYIHNDNRVQHTNDVTLQKAFGMKELHLGTWNRV